MNLTSNCTYPKNYWNRATTVKIIVGTWVVIFFTVSVDYLFSYERLLTLICIINIIII